MLPGEIHIVHLIKCHNALSCLVKFHLVANKRYIDGAKSGQDIFLIEHEEKPPLREAICDIWEPTLKLYQRFADYGIQRVRIDEKKLSC